MSDSDLTSHDVSVVIPAYNAGPFIDAAIESIVTQDSPPDEIIVVDDGSSDDTAKRCAEWGDRVHLIRQARHGVGRARNVGVDTATGRLLAFLDADDLWMPDKLTLQVAHLNAHSSHVAVFGWMQNFIHPGAAITLDARTPTDVRPAYQAPTMLVRREVFAAIGRFDEDGPLQGWVDWYLRLVESGLPLGMIDSLCVRRRIHGANLTLTTPGVTTEYHRLIHASLQRRRARSGEER